MSCLFWIVNNILVKMVEDVDPISLLVLSFSCLLLLYINTGLYFSDTKCNHKGRDCISNKKKSGNELPSQYSVISQNQSSSPEIFLPKEWTYWILTLKVEAVVTEIHKAKARSRQKRALLFSFLFCFNVLLLGTLSSNEMQ